MAEAYKFVCGNCSYSIEAWSDGNPYYIDRNGKKKYLYHPQSLDRCIGNDFPHICLSCGFEFNVDSLSPITECPECKGADRVPITSLDEVRCPYCKEGIFAMDPDFYAIS